ncbi:MAG: Ig-like domain-containing protein [Candidatus Paceibacterota bacterium]
MKKLLIGLFIFGFLAVSAPQVHASILSDALLKIQNLQKEVSSLKSKLGAYALGYTPSYTNLDSSTSLNSSSGTGSVTVDDSCASGAIYSNITGAKCPNVAAPITPTTDGTPRISYWSGKINQHVDIGAQMWQTDADGVSGADIDKLTYCKKWYPKTTSVVEYKNETINAWHDRGNVNDYQNTRISYKCVSDSIFTASTLKTTADISVPTSSAFVTASIVGSSINKEVSYWKLLISCESGVVVSSDKPNLCGTEIRMDTYNMANPSEDYLLLTAGVKNNNSVSSKLTLSLSSYSSSNVRIREDKKEIIIPSSNITTPSITVLSPSEDGKFLPGSQIPISWSSKNTQSDAVVDVSYSSCNDGSCPSYWIQQGLNPTGGFSWQANVGTGFWYINFDLRSKLGVGSYTLDHKSIHIYVGPSTVPVLKVSLDSSSPVSQTIGAGAGNVVFARIKISAGSQNVNNLNAVQILSDLSNATKLNSLSIYDGNKKIGSTRSSLVYDGESYNSWAYLDNKISIPAYTSKVLSIVADTSPIGSSLYFNGNVRLGVMGFKADYPGVVVNPDSAVTYGAMVTVASIPVVIDTGCANGAIFNSITGQRCSIEVTPSIKILSPNVGSTYNAGQTIPINWTAGNPGLSYINFYKSDGTYSTPARVKSNPDTSGYMLYTFPSDIPAGQYKIYAFYEKVINGIFSSIKLYESDGYFNISPSAGIDMGCSNGAIYSNTTGQRCSVVIDNGCNGTRYSTTTGQECRVTGTTITNPTKRVLRWGLIGDDVKALQEFLGIYADGVYGRGTASKVKEWQASQGLYADGVFGNTSRQTAGLDN